MMRIIQLIEKVLSRSKPAACNIFDPILTMHNAEKIGMPLFGAEVWVPTFSGRAFMCWAFSVPRL